MRVSPRGQPRPRGGPAGSVDPPETRYARLPPGGNRALGAARRALKTQNFSVSTGGCAAKYAARLSMSFAVSGSAKPFMIAFFRRPDL